MANAATKSKRRDQRQKSKGRSGGQHKGNAHTEISLDEELEGTVNVGRRSHNGAGRSRRSQGKPSFDREQMAKTDAAAIGDLEIGELLDSLEQLLSGSEDRKFHVAAKHPLMKHCGEAVKVLIEKRKFAGVHILRARLSNALSVRLGLPVIPDNASGVQLRERLAELRAAAS